MYMPSLIPRDVHHLWLQKSSTDGSKQNSNATNKARHNDPEDMNQTMLNTTSPNYAPPLSSYSSERPGALMITSNDGKNSDDCYNNSDLILNDIQIKLRQLKSIRTLGYSYLAPLGIGKTMETLNEEQQIKRQMEQQFEAEPTTAENLLGEVSDLRNMEDDNIEDQEQNVQQFQQQQVQQQVQSAEEEIQRTPRTEVLDLDDEIPEAEENSYSLAYEEDDDLEPVNDANQFESQYDRGFMVTEQYESQEVDESSQHQQQQQQDQQQPHAQFVTPIRHEHTNSNDSEQVGRFVQNNLRSLSGSTSFNTTTDNSFDNVNASINESDLDMTIDE